MTYFISQNFRFSEENLKVEDEFVTVPVYKGGFEIERI